MRRTTTTLAIAFGLALVGRSAAAVDKSALQGIHSLRLDFGKRARGKCTPTSDGVAALLEIRKARRVSLKDFQSAVRVGPYQIRFWASVPGTILGTIEAESGTVGCELRAVKGGHDLIIGRVPRKALLPEIAARGEKTHPLLAGFAHPLVTKEVDELTAKKDYFGAIAILHKYERQGVSEAFTQFRMGELHVLAGQVPTAHARYNRLFTRMPMRGVGLWARARSAELAYVVDGKRPDIELVNVLGGSFVEDEAGKVARRLVAKLLLMHGRAREALGLVLKGTEIADDKLIARILPVALRRAYWNGDAYGAAIDYIRASKRLKKSDVRNADTFFWGGEVMYSLGLPQDASRAYQRALQLSAGTPYKERILVRLIAAYQDARSDFRALQSADYYLSVYSASPHATQIRLRLAQLRIREGDRDGAAKAIAKLPAELGRDLRRVLSTDIDARLAELLKEQPGALKVLQGNAAPLKAVKASKVRSKKTKSVTGAGNAKTETSKSGVEQGAAGTDRKKVN